MEEPVLRKPCAARARRRERPARRLLRGVTLIELALVIVMLAILAGVALPRFGNSIARQRLDAAARRVAADLELGRRRAEQTCATQHVVFSVAQNAYRLSGMPNPDHPGVEYAVCLREYNATLSTNADLTFNGFGVPGSAGTVTIQAGAQSRTITLALNGEIKITE